LWFTFYLGHVFRRAGSGLPRCRQLRVGCRGGDLFVHPRRPCRNRRQLGFQPVAFPGGLRGRGGRRPYLLPHRPGGQPSHRRRPQQFCYQRVIPHRTAAVPAGKHSQPAKQRQLQSVFHDASAIGCGLQRSGGYLDILYTDDALGASRELRNLIRICGRTLLSSESILKRSNRTAFTFTFRPEPSRRTARVQA